MVAGHFTVLTVLYSALLYSREGSGTLFLNAQLADVMFHDPILKLNSNCSLLEYFRSLLMQYTWHTLQLNYCRVGYLLLKLLW